MDEVPRILKFYDTNALLRGLKEIENEEMIYISSITLKELEEIKTSAKKDEDVKYKARCATRWLKENENKYKCIVYTNEIEKIIDSYQLERSNDNKICASVVYLKCLYEMYICQIIFITDDLACRNTAKHIFNLQVEGLKEKSVADDYSGYIQVKMKDEELAHWYENKENRWNLLNNEYILIENNDGEIIDHYRYINEVFEPIRAKDLTSTHLGMFKPKDRCQLLAVDSLSNNKITMLKGKAGTGKSLIAMSFLLSELEKERIDKIIIFCNTVPTRGAARLGFYTGSRDQKLLQSQIGNFLVGKLGDQIAVEEMIEEGKLLLLPMSDIRGYDTSGMNAGIFLTECQNTSIDLMRLALQRIGDDCICIIDGDYTTQVDDVSFIGDNNGMKRMSEVFRGQDFYGEVELKTIFRSRIAAVAELM